MKFLALIMLMFSSNLLAKTEATGLLQLEGGLSYPQNHLTQFISSGTMVRFRIFGGAKLKLGSVGLGWDISYADYELKDGYSGYYKRYVWDWFFFPIGLGFFQITPGVAWVISDTSIKELGLYEQSVRPAGVLALGVRLGVIKNFALTAQIRGEKVWEDMETVDNFYLEEINITGDFISATVGGMIYF